MQDNGDREWALARLNLWRTSRDPEALGQLLKWQRDRAYATALRILGNGADAEDAVQQAFIKLLSRTHGLDTLDQFKVSVYRAVVQCALDMARANRVRAKLEKAMSPLERHTPIPQIAAEQAEALRVVWQELHAMPEESRAMVVLCYQEGLSVSDAAEVLSVPRETLRDRLSASMSELRKKLNQRGVMLSLFVIAGLLQHGNAEAAPLGLCEALDVAVPGPPCSELPAAKAPLATPEFASSSATPVRSFSKIIGLGIAASLLIGVSIWLTFDTATAKMSVSTPHTGAQQTAHNDAIPAVATPSPAVATAPTNVHDLRNETRAATSVAQPARAVVQATRAPAKPLVAGRATKKTPDVQDQPVALADVPVAVRATAEKALAGVVLKEAERKIERNKVIYEIKGAAGGQDYDIVVREDGILVKVVVDDDNEDDEDAAKTKPLLPPAPPNAEF